MRICLVSHEYPPEGTGGIAAYVYTLAHGLTAAGHEVTVIAGTAEAGECATGWAAYSGDKYMCIFC